MEVNDAPKPINMSLNTPSISLNNDIKCLASKEYELKLEEDIYTLKLALLSNEKISFHIRQINNISYYYFYNEYEYDTLIKELVLLHNIMIIWKKFIIFII